MNRHASRSSFPRPIALTAIAIALTATGCTQSTDSPQTVSSSPSPTPLPSGRKIARPPASANIGSFPVNLVLSPDRRFAITTGAGFRQHLCAVRTSDGQKVGDVEFPTSSKDKPNGLYYGLAFAPDGRLYAAMGAARKIAVLSLSPEGALALQQEMNLPPGDFPAGLATDSAGRLYVTHNDPTSATSPFGAAASVSVLAPPSPSPATTQPAARELGRYTFSNDLGLSNFPLALAVNADGSRLYVASERDDAVYVLDASNPADIKLLATLPTGSHPRALLLNKPASTLYVANAQSDTVSIVDTGTNRITHTILLRPQIAQDLAGATPTGLALSSSEHMLYASLADMNAVAVIDLAEKDGPKLEGYIPAGWYPSAIAAIDNTLFITNAKGDLPHVPHDFYTGKSVRSPLYLFEGTLWRLPIARGADLEDLTNLCLDNCRLTPRYLQNENPLQHISLHAPAGIKHVIYIVKENRTYDQVLGDLPQGNGDPARCIFPREVTPNLHALAERFILLDNFYDSGDVSGDGWVWSTQSYANEYTVRNVPYQYSSRGRVFDFEGTNNHYPTGGFPSAGPDGKPLSQDPRFSAGAPPVPDVAAAPGGHLWDLALKHNLSYRNYGFFVTEGVTNKDKQIVIPDNYPAVAALQPAGHDLAGITDIDFRRFDLDFPDSDAPSHFATTLNNPSFYWPRKSFGQGGGQGGGPSRIAEWKREFALMLARDPSGNAVPSFMTVRLGTDHTSGVKALAPTPRCMVADNDYAVGQLVEAVSHSPIWNSTAIFIIEDDAQNGPDHVDAHRSTCYVISPFIKAHTVDHSFQNTVSTIRTIECLLNLPPMSQYDAASAVLPGWDSSPTNTPPYRAILPSREIMAERSPRRATPSTPNADDPNKAATPEITGQASPPAPPLNTLDDLVAASDSMDFSHADRAPADLLNEIIWKSVRGPASQLPPTPHTISRDQPHDTDD